MLHLLRRVVNRLDPLFIIFVLIPTVAAILYYGVFASDVFISESKFVVRSPEKSSPSAIGLLLKGAGFSNAGDEIHVAQGFLDSRDALRELDRDGQFRRAYSRPTISVFNRFDPLGWNGTFEALFKYYKSRVGVEYDAGSSITTLTVRAYQPGDARKFNEQLLRMAEVTVNRLNSRGRQDLIQFANAEVEIAKNQARDAALALSAFRNAKGLVDPDKQAVIQLQMISKLQDELIATKTQLRELREYAPQSPQVPVLVTRIAGLEEEIGRQSGLIAGDQKSLAASAAQYQRLILESQFADRQLAAAMASLQEAQNEARRKQAYVERIAEPNLPDEALEPSRFRSMLTTFMLSMIIWGVASMLLAGIREHRN
ncbi:hypothetical protein [Novosphingobium sp. EMRT-2]|uniref:hypothetical protein n=1 Tax=Novosphingobium sp. EMRT-2 TaxID=2571749 RepID=UPI0010BD8F3C|nr:hypothetical protein [Novosphingobium sp. EMRT-2]QCI93589.1 hypothetical protein FA702_08475 [Novosphingobium sp. EMRT-2]